MTFFDIQSKSLLPIVVVGLLNCGVVLAAGGPKMTPVDYPFAVGSQDGVEMPYVDVYGQKIAVEWPDKVKTDAQLSQAIVDEDTRLKAWSTPSGRYDLYGGSLAEGWHIEPTGFFRVVRHNNVWWLITPAGNPCFYTGVDTTPALSWETTPVTGRENIFAELAPKDGVTADAWGGDPWGSDPGISSYAFCASNLIRKYGPNWKDRFRDVTARRLKAWGFAGIGKWGDPVAGVPSTPSLNRTGVPTLAGHPDPFDSQTAAKLRDVLSAQITPHLNDPLIVAWTVGNEFSEIITTDEIRAIMDGYSSARAKHALIDYLLANSYAGSVSQMDAAWGVQPSSEPPAKDDLYNSTYVNIPDQDVESMRKYYADSYYALLEETVKAIDPNHLFAGFWIVPGDWENESDWFLIARHCDIVGYDYYASHFSQGGFDQLIKAANKPVFCGEFSFPQNHNDRGFSSFGTGVETEEKSAKLYQQYVGEAARNPYCVGVNWFQYRDQPITGRGPGSGPGLVYGENYAFGLVDIADQPKWKLLTAIREVNLEIPKIRSGLR